MGGYSTFSVKWIEFRPYRMRAPFMCTCVAVLLHYLPVLSFDIHSSRLFPVLSFLKQQSWFGILLRMKRIGKWSQLGNDWKKQSKSTQAWHVTVRTLELWTIDIFCTYFLVTVKWGLFIITRVFSVLNLSVLHYKNANLVHYRKSLHLKKCTKKYEVLMARWPHG